MPMRSGRATASTATGTARCCFLGADRFLLRLRLRHAAEPMTEVAVDDFRQQDHIVAQPLDDLFANLRVERLAFYRHLVPFEQPLAQAEEGGEGGALARADLLLALVELFPGQGGA